jgi:hypothetical protein
MHLNVLQQNNFRLIGRNSDNVYGFNAQKEAMRDKSTRYAINYERCGRYYWSRLSRSTWRENPASVLLPEEPPYPIPMR